MGKKTAVLIAAHPIWNVPPFLNVANELSKHGFRVIVVGYHREPLPQFEKIVDDAWILRVRLKFRSIGIAPLRKIGALIEFQSKVKRVLSRIQPDLSIIFNDPTTLALKHAKSTSSVTTCWLLEYPEVDLAGRIEGALLNWCKRHWKNADIFVTPHRQRMALHLSQRPECLKNKCLTIHNTPPSKRMRTELGVNAKCTLQSLAQLKENGKTIFVYAGAVGVRYGIQEILQAVHEVDDAALLILGKRHDLAISEVSEVIPNYKDHSRILWFDEIPYAELHAVISNADVGFAYYHGENLNTRFAAPGKLYEYLSAGLAVLTYEGQEVAPSISLSQSGKVLPHPLVCADLQSVVRELSQENETLSRMKRNARDLFENEFSLEQQMAPFLKVVESKVLVD